MKKDIYVVVGQYNLKSEEYSPLMKELVDNLCELGEVNVFDIPRADSKDEVENDEPLYVHHYLCPNKDITQVDMRTEEMVRDIVHLGAKECFIDYGVDAVYQPLFKAICIALKTYGIKTYTFNKGVPFRFARNLCWGIRFHIDEKKRYEREEYEISQAEGYSGHDSVDGFRLYKIYEKQHQVRKHVLELLKQN